MIQLKVDWAVSRGPFFGGSNLVFCLYSFLRRVESLPYLFGPARRCFDARNQFRNFANMSETKTVQSHKWTFLQYFFRQIIEAALASFTKEIISFSGMRTDRYFYVFFFL